MTANTRQKKVRLSLDQAIRFYLLTELVFFRKLALIDSDLTLLTLLARIGETELPAFCTQAAEQIRAENQSSTPQNSAEQHVRNRIVKLVKRGLVNKHRPGSCTLINLPEDLRLPTDKPLLIDYKILGDASS